MKIFIPVNSWEPDSGPLSPPNGGMMIVEGMAPSSSGVYTSNYAKSRGSTARPTYSHAASVTAGSGGRVFSTGADTYGNAIGRTTAEEIVFVFAHDGAIYARKTSFGAFDNVRRTASVYNVATRAFGGDWSYTQFGNFVMATQHGDDIQIFDLNAYTASGAANFSDITPAAGGADPRAAHICAHKTNVFIADIFLSAPHGIFGSGFTPNGLWCSHDFEPESFGSLATTPSLTGTQQFILADTPGPITGLAATAECLYVFKDNAVYRVDGPPYAPTAICVGIGTSRPKSIVVVKNKVYFMSNAGPALVSGSEVTLLGEGSWSETFNGVKPFQFAGLENPLLQGINNAENLYIAAGYDSLSKNVVWLMPAARRALGSNGWTGSNGAAEVSGGYDMNMILAYNEVSQKASMALIDGTVSSQIDVITVDISTRAIGGLIFLDASRVGQLSTQHEYESSADTFYSEFSNLSTNPMRVSTPWMLMGGSENPKPAIVQRIRPVFSIGGMTHNLTIGPSSVSPDIVVHCTITNKNHPLRAENTLSYDAINRDGELIWNSDKLFLMKRIDFEIYRRVTPTGSQVIPSFGGLVGFEVTLQVQGTKGM